MGEPESVGVSFARNLFAPSPVVKVAFRLEPRNGESVALLSGASNASIFTCCQYCCCTERRERRELIGPIFRVVRENLGAA